MCRSRNIFPPKTFFFRGGYFFTKPCGVCGGEKAQKKLLGGQIGEISHPGGFSGTVDPKELAPWPPTSRKSGFLPLRSIKKNVKPCGPLNSLRGRITINLTPKGFFPGNTKGIIMFPLILELPVKTVNRFRHNV